jgi:hypothetical protein
VAGKQGAIDLSLTVKVESSTIQPVDDVKKIFDKKKNIFGLKKRWKIGLTVWSAEEMAKDLELLFLAAHEAFEPASCFGAAPTG